MQTITVAQINQTKVDTGKLLIQNDWSRRLLLIG